MLHPLTENDGARPQPGRPARAMGFAPQVAMALRTLADGIASGLGRTIKRRLASMQRRAGSPRQLELVETLALGARRQLFIVQFDNQRYLVGAGAESVGTIVAIEPASKPPGKPVKVPHLVRDKGRTTAADVLRRKSFDAIAETGDLWQ